MVSLQKKLLFLLAILFLAGTGILLANENTDALKPIIAVDDAGRLITLNAPAKRIISLAPHITELLFYVGAGDQVLGVDMKSDFPEEAHTIKKISDANQINFEAIIKLKPDLIIAWQSGNNPKQVAKLVELGLPVYFSEPKTLADIEKNILNLGILSGNERYAQEQLKIFKDRITQLTPTAFTSGTAPKVFYQIWHSPLYTIGGNHLISEIIHFCGGKNIFSDIKNIAPQVNIESVLQRNPDLIVSSSNDNNYDKLRLSAQWRKWQSISAVKNEQYLVLNPDYIVRSGPRVIVGIEMICAKISTFEKTDEEI